MTGLIETGFFLSSVYVLRFMLIQLNDVIRPSPT
jgi:hypothetical protein